MSNAICHQRPLFRDQQRALHAFKSVQDVVSRNDVDFDKYERAVQEFGHSLLTAGLCAALAAVQRLGKDGRTLLEHLASAGIHGFEECTADKYEEQSANLESPDYMIASREALSVASWLKRAVQAHRMVNDHA